MERPPDYMPTSPLSLECPLCKVEAGTVCDVLPDRGLEIVYVERIKAAAAIDVATVESRVHFIVLKEVGGIPTEGGYSHCPGVVTTNSAPMGMAREHRYALDACSENIFAWRIPIRHTHYLTGEKYRSSRPGVMRCRDSRESAPASRAVAVFGNDTSAKCLLPLKTRHSNVRGFCELSQRRLARRRDWRHHRRSAIAITPAAKDLGNIFLESFSQKFKKDVADERGYDSDNFDRWKGLYRESSQNLPHTTATYAGSVVNPEEYGR